MTHPLLLSSALALGVTLSPEEIVRVSSLPLGAQRDVVADARKLCQLTIQERLKVLRRRELLSAGAALLLAGCAPIVHSSPVTMDGEYQMGQSWLGQRAPASGLPTTPVNLQNPQLGTKWYYEPSSSVWIPVAPIGASHGHQITYIRSRVLQGFSPALFTMYRNGTGMSRWAPHMDDLFPVWIDTVAAATAAFSGTINPKCFLYDGGQKDGESEAYSLAFGDNLLETRDAVRAAFGLPDLLFIYTRLHIDTTVPFVTNVRDCCDAVNGEDANTFMIDVDSLTLSDGVHIDTSAGNQALGQIYASTAIP